MSLIKSLLKILFIRCFLFQNKVFMLPPNIKKTVAAIFPKSNPFLLGGSKKTSSKSSWNMPGLDAFSVQKLQKIKPKNANQEKYVQLLQNDSVPIVIATGPAGTGKTMFACLQAISFLKRGEIEKIVLTRPLKPVDEEDIGFLPGTKDQKMEVWMQPIYDTFLTMYSKTELEQLRQKNVLEIAPLAYMRGRTFKNAFVIADEMQNSSPQQMKMLVTRPGENCKLVITGDLLQSDRIIASPAFGSKASNGLSFLLDRLEHFFYLSKTDVSNDHSKTEEEESIGTVHFTSDEVERSKITRIMVKLMETIVVEKPGNNFPDQPYKKEKCFGCREKADNNDAALIPKGHF